MKKIIAVVLLAFVSPLMASEGVISVESKYSVKETADRLVAIVKKKELKVFLRLDHAAGAKSVGRELRPTELVVFGNPKLGSALMTCSQAVGIDLPMKALISEDAEGKVWFSYNDTAYLAKRHGIEGCDAPLKKATGALKAFSNAAAAQ